MTPNCMHCNQPLEAHTPLPDGRDSACPDGKNTFNFEFQIHPEVAAFVQENLDKPSDELARLWIERVREKNRRERVAKDPSPTPLVRVFTPEQHHRFEGLVICRDHLRQIVGDDPRGPSYDPFILEEIPTDRAEFWHHRCLMCGVDPSPGRRCENADCRRELHPQWPAVYCCNGCALEDV